MSNRLIVVGGGIVGCSTALFARRIGWDVTLIERDRIGSRASTAAAGILSPPFFLDPEEPVEDQNTQSLLCRKGYDFYPEFLDLLGEYAEVDVGYDVSGMWYLAFDEEEYEDKRTIHREMKKYGRSASWVEGDEILEDLPLLNEEVHGGFFFEEEAQIVPGELVEILDRVIREAGVDVLENTTVGHVEPGAGDGVSVVTGDRDREADAALVAAGCWTPELLKECPIELPVEPRKGEMLRVLAPDLAGFPPVRRGERFVLPRGNGAILGSTVEDAGEDVSTTVGATRDLLNAGVGLVPGLESATVEETWAGLRPYAAMKGGPFLGEVEDTSVYFAAGHYKTGILQGPYTGRLMADYVSGRETEIDVERYGLDR